MYKGSGATAPEEVENNGEWRGYRQPAFSVLQAARKVHVR